VYWGYFAIAAGLAFMIVVAPRNTKIHAQRYLGIKVLGIGLAALTYAILDFLILNGSGVKEFLIFHSMEGAHRTLTLAYGLTVGGLLRVAFRGLEAGERQHDKRVRRD
jgi:hypothetical protein